MPLVLTRRGWALLVWAAVLWSSWWVVGLRDIWHLPAFFGCLVLTAGCAVLILPTIARLKVELAVSETTPRVGEPTEISIGVGQRLALRFRCAAEVDVAGVISRLPVDLTGRQAGFRWAWRASQRGLCSLSIRRLDVQDPLGLVVRRIRPAETMRQLLVLPARCEGTPELLEAVEAIGGTPNQWRARRGPANSVTPSGAVRDYRAGDAPRQMHWKQSARQNKLLANVPESHQPEDQEVSVLLVTSASQYRDDEEFERAVSITATLVERWEQQGYRVRLHAAGQAPMVSASEEELLGHLAVVGFDPVAQDDHLLPAQKHGTVVVTGILTPAAVEQLDHSGTGGAVIVAGQGKHAAAPPGWRLLELPAPTLDADDPEGLRGSSL